MDKLINKKNLIRVFFLAIVVVIFFKWINLIDAVKYLKFLRWEYFILALLFLVILEILKGLRYYYLAKNYTEIDFKRTIIMHLITPILGRATPSKLGESSKIFMLGGKKKELGFCYILERMSDVMLLLIISLFSVLMFTQLVFAYIAIVFIAVIILIIVWKSEKILNFFLRGNLFEKRWFIGFLKQLKLIQLARFILYTVVIWLVFFLSVYLTGISMNIKISFLIITLTYAISQLIGNASGLPGGLGSRELIFAFLLSSYGIPKGLAGIFAIVVIFATLLIESITAVMGYIMLRKQKLYKKE